MRSSSDREFHPKRGRKYQVLSVARISTEHQSEMSLQDQEASYREWLNRHLDGEYVLETIASRGSGERLDREELSELAEKIDAGSYDLLITEDLGRIARRLIAMEICEAAEDSNTRLVAINDGVDTYDENWRQNAFFATMRHETYNRDTSNRIKRSHRNRFRKGDMVRQLPAGYVKPHPGASEAECQKAPGADDVYDEWFARLEQGQTFAEIAAWLNAIDFPTGMATTKLEWDGTLVGQTTRNPILAGRREHNRRISLRVNRTGRRKSVAAPSELLLTREAPHLAFIEARRYERVIRMLEERNAKYRKGIEEANGGTPRSRGTRNDSRWPSQHVNCGICGRKFVLGGHGRKDRMMCDGARKYRCWNAMTVDRAELAAAVNAEVWRLLQQIPNFQDDLFDQVRAEASQLANCHSDRIAELEDQKSKLQHQIENLTNAIASGVCSEALLSRLQATERNLTGIDDRIYELVSRSPDPPSIHDLAELKSLAEDAILAVGNESREYGQLMRRLLSDFYILPYRLVDGGTISPRAIFRFDLGQLDALSLPQHLESLTLNGFVDLTSPPQRCVYRSDVVQLRRKGLNEREVAEQLGITQTAAQNAAKLDREMKLLGVTDPWQPVTTDTEAVNTFKRIKNARYRFEPVKGFTQKFPEVFPA